MITFGFNTLAMLTYGLGITISSGSTRVYEHRPVISFQNKPLGIAAEDKGGPVSSRDSQVAYKQGEVRFK